MAENQENTPKSDQELMSEWDNMLKTPDKTLDQSEIDNLLGVKQEGPEENRGIKALLDSALRSYEKLPMLEIVFDKLVRLLTTALRNLTSETVDIDIITFNSLRVGSYINTIPVPTLITVFKAVEWENFGLLIIDSSLVFSLVDTLFGGKKNTLPVKYDGRAHTEIEQALVRQIADVVLNELGTSFDPITPATFSYERMESNPNFATIARPGDAAILLQLKVEMENRGGKIDLLIPYATLEPIKDLLTQVFMGEKFGVDVEWEENLNDKVINVEVPLEVVISNKPTKIFNIANLKVGNIIMMDHKQDDEVIIRSENVNLFTGRLGKIENNLAVSLERLLIDKIE
ncbi:MAG: fliM [Rickettsiaceae bacterium]|jgi:flagellar motor switch protein FliM|nr:fliM [Rickettsiaceae bacterium]